MRLGIHSEHNFLSAGIAACGSCLQCWPQSDVHMPVEPKTWSQCEAVVDCIIILCIAAETRDRIAYWLKSFPAPTFVAKDGYQANRILRDVRCQVLITDRPLPPWPGLGRINRLRQSGMRIAFVDDRNLESRMLARAVGATDFLAWPLTRRSVLGLLGQSQAQPIVDNF